MGPAGSIAFRRDSIFKDSEGKTERAMFEVVKGDFLFVFDLSLKAVI